MNISTNYCHLDYNGLNPGQSVETLSTVQDILAYFHHSCPAPHVLCIQFSFDSPDIYRTMSYMTGYFQTI